MPSYLDQDCEVQWTDDGEVTILDGAEEVVVPLQFFLDAAQIIGGQMYRIPMTVSQASPSGPVESPESSTTNTLKE